MEIISDLPRQIEYKSKKIQHQGKKVEDISIGNRIILTQYSAYTGVGSYVKGLEALSPHNTSVYSMVFKKDVGNRPYLGKVVKGSFNLPLTSGWFFNSGFQGLAFKQLSKQINSSKKNESSIFHYSDFGIKPFSGPEESILTIHDFFLVSKKYAKYGYKSQPFLKKNVKRYFSFPHLIADTEHIASEAIDFGFESKPEVVYLPVGKHIRPGLNKIECRSKNGLPVDKKLILSISSGDVRKNNGAVKSTMDILGENYKLVRVGPPVEGAYNFNNLDETKINELYNACDVLLFPTLDEGFGYPLVEAMTAGLTVVSSAINSVEEICKNAAVLVNPEPLSLAEGIKQAIGDSDSLILKGLARSLMFTQDKFREKMASIYANISKDF